jgi:hypothetical protein
MGFHIPEGLFESLLFTETKIATCWRLTALEVGGKKFLSMAQAKRSSNLQLLWGSERKITNGNV